MKLLEGLVGSGGTRVGKITRKNRKIENQELTADIILDKASVVEIVNNELKKKEEEYKRLAYTFFKGLGLMLAIFTGVGLVSHDEIVTSFARKILKFDVVLDSLMRNKVAISYNNSFTLDGEQGGDTKAITFYPGVNQRVQMYIEKIPGGASPIKTRIWLNNEYDSPIDFSDSKLNYTGEIKIQQHKDHPRHVIHFQNEEILPSGSSSAKLKRARNIVVFKVLILVKGVEKDEV